MNKNAIKLEILGVRGINIIEKRAKTGEFSAILGQKPGEFGDKFDQNWRFLTIKFCEKCEK